MTSNNRENTSDSGIRDAEGHEPHPSLIDGIFTALFPPAYYKIDEKIKIPKGSQSQMRIGAVISLVTAMIAFALLCFYFSTLTVTESLVSGTMKEGYNCTLLRPKVGVKYLSAFNSSENAQYTGTVMSYDECVTYLSSQDLCSDANRYDYMGVSGIPTSPKYTPLFIFPSGAAVYATVTNPNYFGKLSFPNQSISDAAFPRSPNSPPSSATLVETGGNGERYFMVSRTEGNGGVEGMNVINAIDMSPAPITPLPGASYRQFYDNSLEIFFFFEYDSPLQTGTSLSMGAYYSNPTTLVTSKFLTPASSNNHFHVSGDHHFDIDMSILINDVATYTTSWNFPIFCVLTMV